MTEESQTTPLTEIARLRAEAIRLVADANRMLVSNGRPPTAAPAAGRLRLALLGQYNAGKSTLINALLGARVAETGDRPQTLRAHIFEWRGFDIIDLPGTDAREGEQQAALDEAHRAHAVLFVVSSQSGIEIDTTWQTLDALHRDRVAYAFVINDKQPHQTEDDERQHRDAVLARMRLLSAQRLQGRGPDQALWVNGLRAERGRLEGVDAFVRASGIELLEIDLAERLYRNDEILRDLSNLATVAAALESLRAELAAQLTDADTRAISDAVAGCTAARERLAMAAESIAAERFAHLADSAGAALTASVAASDADRERTAEAVTNLVRTTFQDAATAFVTRIEGEAGRLQAQIDGVPVVAAAMSGEVTVPPMAMPGISSGKDAFPIGRVVASLGAARQVMNLFPAVAATGRAGVQAAGAGAGAATAIEATAAAGARAGAIESAEAAAKGGAGRGASALGRALGVAVIALTIAWEVWQAHQRAKREDAAYQATLRDAAAKGALAAAAVRDAFVARAASAVEAMLAPVEKHLRGAFAQGSQRQAELGSRVAAASDLAARLTDLRARLAARTRG